MLLHTFTHLVKRDNILHTFGTTYILGLLNFWKIIILKLSKHRHIDQALPGCTHPCPHVGQNLKTDRQTDRLSTNYPYSSCWTLVENYQPWPNHSSLWAPVWGILWASTKHFCHLERPYLLLLCSIGYNVIKWSHCELKRDLLCFLNICHDIIS